jgi:hypothetical protein
MGKIIKRVNLQQWIREKTNGSITVVELGAMFFEKLKHVSPTVQTKIGIEIWEPYIKSDVDHFGVPVLQDCIKIHGSVLDYKELLKNYEKDTAMIIDVLEHFDKDVAFKFFNDLKKDFKKIILMVPAGEFPQTEDHSGFEAHDYQTHRSSWYEEDIIKLGFDEIILDDMFHANPELIANNMDTGCWFCVWTKK